jgi:peptide chain release factor
MSFLSLPLRLARPCLLSTRAIRASPIPNRRFCRPSAIAQHAVSEPQSSLQADRREPLEADQSPELEPSESTRPQHVRSIKQLPPRRQIADDEIEEKFLKGSGPGGQKINKTSSAVQLKHLPTGVVVKCQETRSRSQNRKIARRLLAERVDQLEHGDQSREGLKQAMRARKKSSKAKKARRKYRALEEDNKSQQQQAGEGVAGAEQGG